MQKLKVGDRIKLWDGEGVLDAIGRLARCGVGTDMSEEGGNWLEVTEIKQGHYVFTLSHEEMENWDE